MKCVEGVHRPMKATQLEEQDAFNKIKWRLNAKGGLYKPDNLAPIITFYCVIYLLSFILVIYR